jgi:NAD(P)-dependent dehydrogenase (short-subunit alcohol dehydrogenase family)
VTTGGPGRLEGKVAVITGAARGIGRATLEVFVAEGARVVATDIDGAALDETARAVSADVVTVAGDVSDEDDARAMVEAAVSSFGRIDVLVANAGVIPLSTIDQTSVADWDQVMAVDGRGMFLTCKFAIAQMAQQSDQQDDGRGSGSLVLLSSISGLRGQVGQAAYGPAKYVATGLTHHLAIEWAARGIRVNAVAPGTIRTDAVAAVLDTPDGRAYVEEIEGRHPIGRLGEPREVAEVIAFLASDAASFVTGVVLPVDGGYLAQ